jgi:prevent-host-death family protein
MSERKRTREPSNRWQLQDAKARFSELVEKAVTEGPQVVTRRRKEAVVVLSIEAWQDVQRRAGPSLKDLLLSDDARTDNLVPPRRRWKLRAPPSFDD